MEDNFLFSLPRRPARMPATFSATYDVSNTTDSNCIVKAVSPSVFLTFLTLLFVLLPPTIFLPPLCMLSDLLLLHTPTLLLQDASNPISPEIKTFCLEIKNNTSSLMSFLRQVKNQRSVDTDLIPTAHFFCCCRFLKFAIELLNAYFLRFCFFHSANKEISQIIFYFSYNLH